MLHWFIHQSHYILTSKNDDSVPIIERNAFKMQSLWNFWIRDGFSIESFHFKLRQIVFSRISIACSKEIELKILKNSFLFVYFGNAPKRSLSDLCYFLARGFFVRSTSADDLRKLTFVFVTDKTNSISNGQRKHNAIRQTH